MEEMFGDVSIDNFILKGPLGLWGILGFLPNLDHKICYQIIIGDFKLPTKSRLLIKKIFKLFFP